jgi:tRNA nucleotidyltransferase (CCA-adding enzyme)
MSEPRAVELLDRFLNSLQPVAAQAIETAVCWAAETGAALYLVGGTTRDLLCGVRPLDIDIAVEGDALVLGALLAERFAAELTSHRDFSTAIVEGDGWRIDLARTRTEQYAYSGALPAVRPATIEDDLGRRDFAANAIALRLAPLPTHLLDPFGAITDLRSGLLRILHPFSFVDDPSRILRMARYAARLGWQIEAATDERARAAAPLLTNISPARVWHELVRTLEEPRPEDALHILARYPAATRALGLDRRRFEPFARTCEALRAANERPTPEKYLAAAAACDALADDALELLALPDNAARAVEDAYAALEAAQNWAQANSPDEVALATALDRCVQSAVEGAQAALLAVAVSDWTAVEARFAAELLARYLREWRLLRPRLDGNAVQSLGVARGPAIGRALQRLRAARILGETQSDEDERRLVLRWIDEGQL